LWRTLTEECCQVSQSWLSCGKQYIICAGPNGILCITNLSVATQQKTGVGPKGISHDSRLAHETSDAIAKRPVWADNPHTTSNAGGMLDWPAYQLLKVR